MDHLWATTYFLKVYYIIGTTDADRVGDVLLHI
jgi:hypothetical protein